MNDLHDPIDSVDHDDPVDRLGRTAGAALRRPAPADGMRRLRTARRRQQVTRVAAAGATALVFAAGAFVLTRPDDEQISTVTTPTTEVSPTVPATTTPASTVPTTVPTTSPVPSTTAETVAPTTTPVTTPTTEPAIPSGDPPAVPTISAALVDWANGQRDAGRPFLRQIPGQGTDASIYVASNVDSVGRIVPDDAASTYAHVIVLGDGRVAPLPDVVAPSGQDAGMQLVGLGDRIAAIPVSTSATAVSEPDLLLLDLDALTWSVGVDLSWTPMIDVFANARSVGGSVVIGRFGWANGPSGLTPVDGRDAVIVRPDLSVEVVPEAPENVQTSWTSDSGDLAFSVGYSGSGSGFSYPPTPNIWALDVAVNEWVEVPNPEWISCSDCDWKQPGEHSDPFLEVGTDRGLVVRVPDGSIGLFDSVARTWRRLDDAPFDPALPFTTVVGDRVVVAPMESQVDGAQNGTVGVLDVAAGTWTTARFAIDTTTNLNWDIRTANGAALLQPSQGANETGAIDLAVARVVDADGVWWPVSADDVGAWAASVTGFEAVDLRSVPLG